MESIFAYRSTLSCILAVSFSIPGKCMALRRKPSAPARALCLARLEAISAGEVWEVSVGEAGEHLVMVWDCSSKVLQ